MVSFNFKPDFVPMIVDGSKIQTIRSSMRCQPGDTMHIFTGLRTKKCERVGEAICQAVFPVMFREDSFHSGEHIKVNEINDPEALLKFAEMDGFSSWEQCHGFFRNHYDFPFTGFVHRWDPESFKPAKKDQCNARGNQL